MCSVRIRSCNCTSRKHSIVAKGKVWTSTNDCSPPTPSTITPTRVPSPFANLGTPCQLEQRSTGRQVIVTMLVILLHPLIPHTRHRTCYNIDRSKLMSFLICRGFPKTFNRRLSRSTRIFQLKESKNCSSRVRFVASWQSMTWMRMS